MSKSGDTGGEAGREQLLARAAQCYRSAGLEQDACRCLERAGNFSGAGQIHEQAERWSEAAHCFEQARQWPLAARCFLAAGMPEDGARSQLAAGNHLEAAWAYAHHAHRFEAARAALIGYAATGAEQELALLLAQARCAVPQKGGVAARLLHQVCARLGELAEGSGRKRVIDWAFALGHEVLDRPDLMIELMCAACGANIDIRERWESWARQRLGGTEGMAGLMETEAGEGMAPATGMEHRNNTNEEVTS